MLQAIDSVPVEIYRYRVVYPGGTYIRVSPDVDSERTGDIIDYGVVFEASKSLVLDGITYIKLADNRGWVFRNKGDTEVLEMVDVIRVPAYSATKALIDNGNDKAASSRTIRGSHSHSGFTKEANLKSGDDWSTLSASSGNNTTLTSSVPDTVFVSHPTVHLAIKGKEKLFHAARAEDRFWKDVRLQTMACESFESFCGLCTLAESKHAATFATQQQQLNHDMRKCINLIASITKQCAPDVAELDGLETALWVFAHLGSHSAHVMKLCFEAANNRLNTIENEWQTALLLLVLEAGSRVKVQCANLSKLADVLEQDTKDFVQRWVVIKSYEVDFLQDEPVDDGRDEELAHSPTPTAQRLPHPWLSSLVPPWMCDNETVPGRTIGKGATQMARDRALGTRRDGQQTAERDKQEVEDGRGRDDDRGEDFWKNVKRSLKKLIADPDVQFANII